MVLGGKEAHGWRWWRVCGWRWKVTKALLQPRAGASTRRNSAQQLSLDDTRPDVGRRMSR